MKELRRFLVALGYFTRIPIPAWVGWAPEELNRAARYFPLVGLLVGGVAALVYALTTQIWSPEIAVLLSMATSVLLTGAFHEDGLADSADGFGGGYTPARVLEIMKDSRIGSFAAIALILALLGKFTLLSALASLSTTHVVVALLLMHPLSRAAALCLMAALPYVRDTDTRTKPVAEGITRFEILIGLGSALLIAAALGSTGAFTPLRLLILLLAVGMSTLLYGHYFRRRIGGYTGDCLGATQQLTELTGYLVLCAA